MVSKRVPRKWTVEEYLAYEETSECRHEFIDGDIFDMAGGTENYSLITGNTFFAVKQRLLDSVCRVHTSDMRTKISDTKYVYPDFSVVCGKAEFADENHTMLTNPTMCVEVMSPSSEDYDKNLKSDFYRSLPSLKHYLIIDQGKVYVRLYTRLEKGWLLQEFKDMTDSIPLQALNIDLPLSEVYRDITFESEAN